ncbi:hypothetical protein ACTFIR_003846 [Dictyostelium discoideum]
MNSSANFRSPNGNSSILNQSPIHQRTNNSSNISTGDESFHNNFSLSNEIEPVYQMTDNPHVPLEYILSYESLQKLCKKQYYSDGNVSPLFIAGIILQAGVAESLSNYSKGNKNHLLKVYISDNQNFAGNEIFTPTLLSFFLTQQVNFENYQNDVFIKQFVDSCKIGEEKQWYHDSVPLNKLLISILKDFSKKFDASEKLRKDAQACFEFGDTPLYLNNSNS